MRFPNSRSQGINVCGSRKISVLSIVKLLSHTKVGNITAVPTHENVLWALCKDSAYDPADPLCPVPNFHSASLWMTIWIP